MGHTVARFLKLWLIHASKAAQADLLFIWSGILFLVGKTVRFLLFFIFLFTVLSSIEGFAGYSYQQVIVFFLVFNIIDISVQSLFRGVYWFRSLRSSGNFDLDLLKPLPSFFRPLFGWTDILDLITLIPLWIYFVWYGAQNGFLTDFGRIVLFFILFANSLVLASAFHLFICAVCILTTTIDPLVWIYRDLANMARFPTDIYTKGIQFILTFTIPVVILITVPTKALLGMLSWPWIVGAFLISGLFLFGSLKFWRYALSQYSSASS